jgi:hypothetical protein
MAATADLDLPEAMMVPTSLMIENVARVAAILKLANKLTYSMEFDPISLQRITKWQVLAERVEVLAEEAEDTLVDGVFDLPGGDESDPTGEVYWSHPVNVEIRRQREIFEEREA